MSRVTAYLLAASLLASGIASAQSTFGSITGMVKDTSGGLVPAASVEVINLDTGIVHKVSTTSAGVFNVPDLDIGTYKVRVTAKGFATYERVDLQLAANQILNLDVALTLGATTTVLQVQESAPAIQTEAVDLSNGISHTSLEAIPFVGRHDAGTGGIYTYVGMTAGAGIPTSGGVPSLAGIRVTSGSLPTMDGIAVMSYAEGAGPVQPSLEGIQELKIETSVAPAEYSTAGTYQVVTKSGSNQFHGSAFWDYNSDVLNARTFFASSVPFRVYHNFAGSIGGPVKKNKIFFYGDYEGAREHATRTVTASVPLPAWRTGNLASLGKAVTDPATGQPFPNMMIPASRINPVSMNILNFAYPLPNVGAPGALSNNYVNNLPGTTAMTIFDSFDTRADFNLTSRDSVFARASYRRIPLLVPGDYQLYRVQTRWGESGVISWTHILSPNIINETRGGVTYHRNYYHANIVGTQLMQQFGITGVTTPPEPVGPGFNISGGVSSWSSDDNSVDFQDNPETTLEWIDNLSWTHGKHIMKFGFDFIHDRALGVNVNANAYGVYSFTGIYTGNGFGDFLLGIPNTSQFASINPNRYLNGITSGIFAQDQYRVSSKLTLNFGIRWQIEPPYSDGHGALYTWNPATGGLVIPNNATNLISRFYPKNINIATASQAGFPNSLINTDWHMFEPRVGFAFKPFGEKTVIRGGYGVYSNLIWASLARSFMNGGPFSGSTTYQNSIVNGVPLFQFPTPLLTSGTSATQNVNGINPHITDPYTEQLNLSVERQVGSFGFRVSYVGSRSIKLLYIRNLNEPAPTTAPFSTKLYPYQLYSTIAYADNGGTDVYNGLELVANKKYGQNLTLTAGFTWAKDLTDAYDSGSGGSSYAGQQIQNQFNRDAEKGNSALVSPRRFFAYGVYALPYGPGQHFGAHSPKVLQAILGGWRTNWTLILQAGAYFTPAFSGSDPSNTGIVGGRPDVIPGVPLYPSNQSISHWFNPAAFAIPGCPLSTPFCGNPANVGRFGTAGNFILEGPPIRNLDFALEKDFAIRERYRVQFNMNMANALNHPNFSAPNATINAATAGIISGTTAALLSEPASRNIDFILRVQF